MLKVLTVVGTLLFCLQLQAEVGGPVRVKLLRFSLPLKLEGQGLEFAPSSLGVKKISIPMQESLTIDQAVVAGKKFWIVKNGSKITRLEVPYIEIKSFSDKINIMGFEFPSPLLFSTKQSPRSVDIIASLNFEDYLADVLLSEMPSSWPLEALKSQAVATRSYATFQMNARMKEPFQLQADNLDQAFAFHSASPAKTKIKRALFETKGKILMINQHFVKAFFHSDCGGKTEDPGSVWGTSDGLSNTGTAVDPHCPFNPGSKWSYEISFKELKNKLEQNGDLLQGILDVRIISRTPSLRVGRLAFNDGSQVVTFTGNDFRKMIGFSKIKSTLFDIEKHGDLLKFIGRGFGHGSGLCQWGAKYMADHGAGYLDILKHYYPLANVSTYPLLQSHVAHR